MITTPWGNVWLAGLEDSLSGWWFENHRHAPALQLGWVGELQSNRLEKKEDYKHSSLGNCARRSIRHSHSTMVAPISR